MVARVVARTYSLILFVGSDEHSLYGLRAPAVRFDAAGVFAPAFLSEDRYTWPLSHVY